MYRKLTDGAPQSPKPRAAGRIDIADTEAQGLRRRSAASLGRAA
jgi:hypothetical protein